MDEITPPDIFERIVHTTDFYQVRLTVKEFRGIEYLHLRKYYLDFDEEWHPSKEGISIPLDIENSKELFIGLLEILSLAESKKLIKDNFFDIIKELYED
jgi:hypothetical protein